MPANPFTKKFQESDKLLKAMDTRIGAIEKLVKTMDARIKVVADSMTSSKDIENYLAVLEKGNKNKIEALEKAVKSDMDRLEKTHQSYDFVDRKEIIKQITAMEKSEKELRDAEYKASARHFKLTEKAAEAREKEFQKERNAFEKERAKNAELQKESLKPFKEMQKNLKDAKIDQMWARLAAVETMAKAALSK
ncbi:hypothetical protein [Parasedimentitalea maritima]|uniref:Uncharacterized protein n=1 Tax=Parasedimentitalea maritima TaxID=2578117 RepID=A0A6A4RHG4_9RHOB|nr:hypothetical protein [Zongyanglinia marina]KAE9630420.1 hypothetical protein GP644_08445 [Zongyanglinia marina]